MIQIGFFLSMSLLLYIYIGYPLLLWVASVSVRRRAAPVSELPSVSLIIAARNEERALAAKIENLKTWRYPVSRLEVILVSDGSTDETVPRFEKSMNRWREEGPVPVSMVVDLAQQKGKSLAQNEAVSHARHEILVFSDAATLFEPFALERLLAPFADPAVGCATGRARYRNTHDSGAAESEGAYFRYELWIRRMESRLGMLAMGSGCIFAVRRSLFEPLRAEEGEDWVLALRSIDAGYRMVQVDEAIAWDELATTSQGLFRTKVRIISKDFRALYQRRTLLNPFRYGRAAVALWSHKFLRWLSFLWMALAFGLNAWLVRENRFFAAMFAAQIVFYSLSLLGVWLESRQRSEWPGRRWLSIPYHFCVVQAAAALGVWKASVGRSEVFWQPIRSAQS